MRHYNIEIKVSKRLIKWAFKKEWHLKLFFKYLELIIIIERREMKEYHCHDIIGPGVTVMAPEKCCLFCKHCIDIWWDYTNGPYMLCCEIFDCPKSCGGKGVPSDVGGPEGSCEFFEEV